MRVKLPNGWQCPICKTIYSPAVESCAVCSPKSKKKITIRSTQLPKSYSSSGGCGGRTLGGCGGTRSSHEGGCGNRGGC